MKPSKFKLIGISIGLLVAFSMFFFFYLTNQHTYSPTDPTIVETDKNLKIAIIGAGAAGLTAAHTLNASGYKNVTVFEREATAGGKVCSYEYNGHFYELGAVYFDSVYSHTMLDLIKDLGINYVDWDGPIGTFNMAGHWWFRRDMKKTIAKVPPKFRSKIQNIHNNTDMVARWNKFQLLKAYLNWKWILFKHQRTMVSTPGFPSTLSEMYPNFKDFAVTHHLVPMAHPMSVFMTACGYGYHEQVPAVNYMKVIPVALASDRRRSCFENGWQSFWQKVADSLTVRYNAEVTKVNRFKENIHDKIEITAGGKTETFDRVIISAPLELAHHFMMLSEKEASLFKKIKNFEYYVTLVKLKKALNKDPNLPNQPLTGGVIDHIYPDTIGHIVCVLKSMHNDENVYTFYQLNDWRKSPDEMFQILNEDISKLGGVIDKNAPNNGIIIQKKWTYFPHVSTKDLQEGFYDNLMDLQGTQGTYYIGSIMDFESVEHTARFSKYLMERHFH
ncbi:MAG: FAD-dependent oxidoreductase [Desulfobacteraceae bacterium]|nr:FAD-dependent oxidoreductase [Desulfobacteraceae bacterium]